MTGWNCSKTVSELQSSACFWLKSISCPVLFKFKLFANVCETEKPHRNILQHVFLFEDGSIKWFIRHPLAVSHLQEPQSLKNIAGVQQTWVVQKIDIDTVIIFPCWHRNDFVSSVAVYPSSRLTEAYSVYVWLCQSDFIILHRWIFLWEMFLLHWKKFQLWDCEYFCRICLSKWLENSKRQLWVHHCSLKITMSKL